MPLMGINTTFVKQLLTLYSTKNTMNNILYTIAVILVVLWAIGFLGYHSGGILHLLLVLAAMAILIRIIRGDKIV